VCIAIVPVICGAVLEVVVLAQRQAWTRLGGGNQNSSRD